MEDAALTECFSSLRKDSLPPSLGLSHADDSLMSKYLLTPVDHKLRESVSLASTSVKLHKSRWAQQEEGALASSSLCVPFGATFFY